MAYTTDLGSVGVIDESNFQQYVEDNVQRSGEMGSGYKIRPYDSKPLGSYAPIFQNQRRFPRRQWDDLIKLQDDHFSSPYHHHKASNVPILDQNGFPYCWMFGLVAGMMNCYAISGLPVPYLSATGPAAQGKNFRQQGGWAGEAIEYVDRYGVPTVDTWPEHSLDRDLPNNPDQKADAKRHKVVDFLELPSQDFEAAASVLLDPLRPRPVTLGLMWWGHLVCGLRLVKISRNEYGILIVNSWDETWGDGGYKVLTERRATAHEQIAISHVSPRSA